MPHCDIFNTSSRLMTPFFSFDFIIGFFKVVARHEDLLAQATGIESLEGKYSYIILAILTVEEALLGSVQGTNSLPALAPDVKAPDLISEE